MGTRTIQGRRALDRAGVAAYTGAAEPTVGRRHLDRERTKFPTVCHTDEDGRHWYWATEITAFWKDTKRPGKTRSPQSTAAATPANW